MIENIILNAYFGKFKTDNDVIKLQGWRNYSFLLSFYDFNL